MKLITASRSRYRILVPLVLLCLSAAPAAGEVDGKIDHEELTAKLGAFEGEVHYGGLMIAEGDSVHGEVLVISGS
ncbi:MAG TPA: hypothetical protein VLA34_11400, partial [Candidatus Krumholzibacterium sp.]|nr:hypothetical protein [Candidatus Krumholzibacterium sp.]